MCEYIFIYIYIYIYIYYSVYRGCHLCIYSGQLTLTVSYPRPQQRELQLLDAFPVILQKRPLVPEL